MWFILSSCSCDLCVCVNAQVVGLSNEKYNFVENVIVMMYVVHVHGGAVTLLDIPGGGNKVVKEF